jgi:hypothetical protein
MLQPLGTSLTLTAAMLTVLLVARLLLRALGGARRLAVLLFLSLALAAPAVADPGDVRGVLPRLDRVPTLPVVTVRPGDSLWRIAARHLPPGHTVADVARWWPQWYRLNRGLVGPDPDLLHPGQRLRPPALPTPAKGRP